jgi:hypothetical protein
MHPGDHLGAAVDGGSGEGADCLTSHPRQPRQGTHSSNSCAAALPRKQRRCHRRNALLAPSGTSQLSRPTPNSSGSARESLASVSPRMLKLTTPSRWPGLFLAATRRRADTDCPARVGGSASSNALTDGKYAAARGWADGARASCSPPDPPVQVRSVRQDYAVAAYPADSAKQALALLSRTFGWFRRAAAPSTRTDLSAVEWQGHFEDSVLKVVVSR